jgi:hypothetical protein
LSSSWGSGVRNLEARPRERPGSHRSPSPLQRRELDNDLRLGKLSAASRPAFRYAQRNIDADRAVPNASVACAARFEKRTSTVDDIIVSPTKSVSYAIVGVGGFLGVANHNVAVSVGEFRDRGGKLVVAGASKEALKSMPPFEYAS